MAEKAEVRIIEHADHSFTENREKLITESIDFFRRYL
jgi:hypothetical protein